MKKLYICLFLLVVNLAVANPIDDVEAKTGLNFEPKLDTAKQKVLETAKPDFKNWSGISK